MFRSHLRWTMCRAAMDHTREADDPWGGAAEDGPAEQDELSREWAARREHFYNVREAPCVPRGVPLTLPQQLLHSADAAQSGYREGLDEGKGETIQQGFDAGRRCWPVPQPHLLCRRASLSGSLRRQASQRASQLAGTRAAFTAH